MYCEEIHEVFKKIPVTLLGPVDYTHKRLLLTDAGGKCFINKIQPKPPQIKSPRLIKEAKKKEENIKENI